MSNKDRARNLSVPAVLSVARIPEEPVAPARRNDAIVFVRELTRELIREISPAAKLIALLSVAIIACVVLYVGHAAFVAYRQQQESLRLRALQTRQMAEHDSQLAQLSHRVDESSQQISSLVKTDSDLREMSQSVLYNLSLPTRLWNSYNDGTCLIAGSYVLIDRSTGRPLRFPEADMNPAQVLLNSGTEVPLTPEGSGPIFELEFLGTGFHVGGGYVLTNRHVASQPWAVDQRAQFLTESTGATPRLEKLLAFFPGRQQPIALKFKTASPSDDVSVCTLEITPASIPVLPLDQKSGSVKIGQAVVMMGYPTGPNRMLALLPEKEALAVQDKYGASLVLLLDQLARRKLIKPLTTQGHITDLYKNRIVFDAATSDGSSGTAMFGESGQVIGITFAIFTDSTASNFAVPISVGIEQLKKAGWKP